MPLIAGSRLSLYDIGSVVGAGGMGEVCRARDTRLERTVAIKLFPPGLASSPDFRMRFRCAAKAISALNHPHICTLFDVGEETEEVDAPGLFPRGRCLHLRLVVKIRRLI